MFSSCFYQEFILLCKSKPIYKGKCERAYMSWFYKKNDVLLFLNLLKINFKEHIHKNTINTFIFLKIVLKKYLFITDYA